MNLVLPEAETPALETWVNDRAGFAIAEVIGDPQRRSLDAIHLAGAHAVRSALTALVTYDKRMATAAVELGLPVVSPA